MVCSGVEEMKVENKWGNRQLEGLKLVESINTGTYEKGNEWIGEQGEEQRIEGNK